MFVASYSRTMAGAKQVVPDSGIEMQNRSRRARLIAQAQRWHTLRQRKMDEDRRRVEAAQAALLASLPMTARQVIRAVAEASGLTYEDVIGTSRLPAIVAVRHDAIAEVYDRFYDPDERGLGWIGRQFGGRDHTTILHALRKRGRK